MANALVYLWRNVNNPLSEFSSLESNGWTLYRKTYWLDDQFPGDNEEPVIIDKNDRYVLLQLKASENRS